MTCHVDRWILAFNAQSTAKITSGRLQRYQQVPVSGPRLTRHAPVSGPRLEYHVPASGSRLEYHVPASGSKLTRHVPVSGSRLTRHAPVSGSRLERHVPVRESDPSMGCRWRRAEGGEGRRRLDTLISRATSSRHQWRTHTLSIAATRHTLSIAATRHTRQQGDWHSCNKTHSSA